MPVPATRDRLTRPVDISTLLPGATRRVNLIVDEPGLQRVGLIGYGGNRVGGHGRGRNQQRAMVVARRDGGGSVGRRSQLPSWYPRTPLRDITAIMRAIETRRAELRPEAPQEDNNATNAEVESEFVPLTPIPTISVKPKLSSATQVWRMKTGHADWTIDNSENITPQKKLLDSIEKVRRVWLEAQRKHERTPVAKRAERENKVRVLMSMR